MHDILRSTNAFGRIASAKATSEMAQQQQLDTSDSIASAMSIAACLQKNFFSIVSSSTLRSIFDTFLYFLHQTHLVGPAGHSWLLLSCQHASLAQGMAWSNAMYLA